MNKPKLVLVADRMDRTPQEVGLKPGDVPASEVQAQALAQATWGPQALAMFYPGSPRLELRCSVGVHDGETFLPFGYGYDWERAFTMAAFSDDGLELYEINERRKG